LLVGVIGVTDQEVNIGENRFVRAPDLQDMEGSRMTTIKAFGLAVSLLLMSLGLVDPMVLSTPIGY